MKCKGCDADITKTLVMVEEAYGDRATKIIGIETDPENFTSDEHTFSDDEPEEGDFEIILGRTGEEDIRFEVDRYQCSKCFTKYTWEEIKTIFS